MEKAYYSNKDTSDVIVFLTPIYAIVPLGDLVRKRIRRAEFSEHPETPLATLNLHSDRLRHCSKYFATCLDERWSNSRTTKSPMEFILEVRTDVTYYEDCFSQMYAPNFTGIPSVDHALELLKVASQIEFAEPMNASVGYLSVIPWSVVDEKKIREFPFSKYISTSGTSELNDRLRLCGTTEESYRQLYEVGQSYLRWSLNSALESVAYPEGNKQSSCAMFANALNEIVSGSCYNLIKDAFALVTEKAKDVLLDTVEATKEFEFHAPEALEESGFYALQPNLQMVCWLFEIMLNARGAKELVEHIVHDSKCPTFLSDMYSREGVYMFRDRKWTLKWAHTMLSIFKEVLAGRLLLKSSDRVALLKDCQWLFQGAFCCEQEDHVAVAETLSSFLMTLPHEHQTTMLKEWLSQMDNYDYYVPLSVVELSNSMWIKDLQRSLAGLESARAAEMVAKNPDAVDSSSTASFKKIHELIRIMGFSYKSN